MRKSLSPLRVVVQFEFPRLGVLLAGLLVACGFCLDSRGQEVRRLALARDDDRIAERIATFEEAVAAGEQEKAVFLGQRLIESELDGELGADGFLRRHLAAAPGERGLMLDARYLVARRLASLPEAYRARYREILEERARIERARCRPLGPLAALETFRRFPLSAAGMAAAEEAAHAALESGDGPLAARLFGDLLDLDWRADDRQRQARRAGLMLALALDGDLDALPRTGADHALDLGGRPVDLRSLVQELRLRLLRERPDPFAEERPRAIKEVWERPSSGGEIDGGEPLLPRPLLVGDLLVHHDRGAVEALRPETGEPVWERPFGGDEEGALPEMDDPDLLALAGAAAEGRYHFVSASLDDERETRRVLVSLDVADGRELWRFDPRDLEDELGCLRLDPEPLAAGDRVFVTAFDDGSTPCCHVLALDAATGRLLAITRLLPGVPLAYLDHGGEPRPPRHWLGALPLRLVWGFLVVCDDLGHIAALEADSLEPRFLIAYERRRSEGALPTRRHLRNRVLVQEDRLVAAPNDAEGALAFFLRPPGDARRRGDNLLCQRAGVLPSERSERLLAFDGRRVVTAGHDPGENLELIRSRTAFLDAEPGPTWSAPLDSALLGEGFFDQKDVYLCTHKYVYGTDLSEGAVFGPLVSREADGNERLGNLIAVRSGLIVASRRGLRAYRPVP